MSQTVNDALRSLQWVVGLWLDGMDEEFDVRLEEEQAGWERPTALIQTAGPRLMEGPRRWTVHTRPFVIYIFPKAPKTTKDASLEAASIEDELERMFRIGNGVLGLHPNRIPLYDWTDIPSNEALPDGAVNPAYLWINDINTDRRKDPDDPLLWTVICNLRLRWRSPGEALPGGPLAESVTVHPADVS